MQKKWIGKKTSNKIYHRQLPTPKVNSKTYTLMKQVIEEKDKDLTQLQTFYEQREWLLALPPGIFIDSP